MSLETDAPVGLGSGDAGRLREIAAVYAATLSLGDIAHLLHVADALDATWPDDATNPQAWKAWHLTAAAPSKPTTED